jgi:Uma2 family endonuclease
MATKTLLTIEQYKALDEPAGVRYELDQGELIVTPSPATRHNLVCGHIYSRMSSWVEEHDLGLVVYEVDVKLAEDTVRRPDIMFIRRERMQEVDLDQAPVRVVPDLVIEVVSKHDHPDDLMLKIRQYQRAGVQATWVLYPKTRQAYRYGPHALQPTVFDAERGDKLEEPDLLPGLSLPLSEILP